MVLERVILTHMGLWPPCSLGDRKREAGGLPSILQSVDRLYSAAMAGLPNCAKRSRVVAPQFAGARRALIPQATLAGVNMFSQFDFQAMMRRPHGLPTS